MKPLRARFFASRRGLGSAFLTVFLLGLLNTAWANNKLTLTFENADLQQVIKQIGLLTDTTFLFDPEQVKGQITLLAPRKVSPERALKLLEAALTLQGYTLLRKEDSMWIVPTEEAARGEVRLEVVPLQYGRAAELAYALAAIAPAGVRIVPYVPTNSLLIAGDGQRVDELIKVIQDKEKEDKKKEDKEKEDKKKEDKKKEDKEKEDKEKDPE